LQPFERRKKKGVEPASQGNAWTIAVRGVFENERQLERRKTSPSDGRRSARGVIQEPQPRNGRRYARKLAPGPGETRETGKIDTRHDKGREDQNNPTTSTVYEKNEKARITDGAGFVVKDGEKRRKKKVKELQSVIHRKRKEEARMQIVRYLEENSA